MGQLGYALTGAAQGYAQGRQLKDEMDYKKKQRQQQASEDQWRRDQANKEWNYREGEQARNDLSQVERYLNDPNANLNYTPEQLANFEAKRKAIYARHPDLDPSQVQAPAGGDLPYGMGTGGGEPVHTAPPQGPAPAASDGTIAPADLFDLQQQQKERDAANAPPWHQDPLQAMGVGAATQEPAVGGPPITGSQNPVNAGSFPPNPFPQNVPAPAPPAAVPQAPVGVTPAGPPNPGDANNIFVDAIKGAVKAISQAKTPAQEKAARSELIGYLSEYGKFDHEGAQALLQRIMAGEFKETAQSERDVNAEKVQSSIDERTKFRPRELQINEDKNDIAALQHLAELQRQGRLDARDEAEFNLKLRNYGLDAKKFQLEVDKAGIEQVMKEQQYAKGVVDLATAKQDYEKKKSDPTYMQKLTAETIAKHAYSPDPLSHNVYAGPTNQEWNAMSGGAGGTTADQTANGPAHNSTGAKSFDGKAFMAAKDGLTPAQKKIVIEAKRKMGYTIR